MDRLSVLPDALIIHILSFLPDPKMLLQTSVLAKAWRFHWSRVPGFGFAKQQPQITNTNENYSNTCFHIGPATSNREFDTWVAAVFASNIRYLIIHLNSQLTLPPCLFTSETLLYLRILDCENIFGGCYDYPDCSLPTVHFPALKKLQLVNVGCQSDYSFTPILKGCPVLEELKILNDEYCVLITETQTETLARLELDIENPQTVLLVIPSLRYLHLRVLKSERQIIHLHVGEPLPLLTEADIDLMAASRYHSPREVTNFVGKLYNVKRLALSTCQLVDVPTSYFEELGDVEFNNLTQLNLRADWRFIPCFLKNSINLRVLTILVDRCHSTQHWREPKQVPACLVSHLERVNLIDFGWSTHHEFDMLKYILKNANVLKRMEIISTRQNQLDWNVKLEAIKKFTMFEIGSTTCEVILTLDDVEI